MALNKTKTPQDSTSSEKATNPKQDLSDIMAALDPSLGNPGMNVTVNTPIISNPPMMPTDQSIQQVQIASALGASQLGPGASSLTGQHGAYYQAKTAELHAALNFNEQVRTPGAQVAIGDIKLSLPADIRDNPNRLYVSGIGTYIRQRADKILEALFGEEMSPRVYLGAQCRGFGAKPLVWVSQALYHDVSTDVQHDFDKLEDAVPYDAEIDAGTSSPVLHALNQCFEAVTVRNLSRMAKFHNVSVLTVFRTIISDILDKHKIYVPQGE